MSPARKGGEPVRMPLWQAALDGLGAAGYLEYGVQVTWREFFGSMGMSHCPEGPMHEWTWEYRGPFLRFQQEVKITHGLYPELTGMGGKGFRFIVENKMAGELDRRERKKARATTVAAAALARVPHAKLTAKEVKQLEFVQAKTAILAEFSAEIHRRQKNLPVNVTQRLLEQEKTGRKKGDGDNGSKE